jgi:transposase
MGTSMPTVSTWSSRFERYGLDGLKDKAGRGRRPSIPSAKIERVIAQVTRPPAGRNRWSVRSMGRHAGISHSTVQRIWTKNDLKPHLVKTFKLSRDPKFEEKFWDVIGLYLDPPAKALVLCCDEKSQGANVYRERQALTQVSGLGAHSTRAAAGARKAAHDDARLHAPWHCDAVRRAQCARRQADRAH